jgi:hypothetical protein
MSLKIGDEFNLLDWHFLVNSANENYCFPFCGSPPHGVGNFGGFSMARYARCQGGDDSRGAQGRIPSLAGHHEAVVLSSVRVCSLILLAGSEQGFGFPKGDRGQVPCGTQATAPESGLFPPILSRHVRDAPPGRRIFRYPFHPLDWEKSNFCTFSRQSKFVAPGDG